MTFRGFVFGAAVNSASAGFIQDGATDAVDGHAAFLTTLGIGFETLHPYESDISTYYTWSDADNVNRCQGTLDADVLAAVHNDLCSVKCAVDNRAHRNLDGSVMTDCVHTLPSGNCCGGFAEFGTGFHSPTALCTTETRVQTLARQLERVNGYQVLEEADTDGTGNYKVFELTQYGCTPKSGGDADRWTWHKKIFDEDTYIAHGNACNAGDTVYVTAPAPNEAFAGYYQDYCRVADNCNAANQAGRLYYSEDRMRRVRWDAHHEGYEISELTGTRGDAATVTTTSTCPNQEDAANWLWGYNWGDPGFRVSMCSDLYSLANGAYFTQAPFLKGICHQTAVNNGVELDADCATASAAALSLFDDENKFYFNNKIFT